MASIDDELLLDEQEMQREMVYIREQLPQQLKTKYSDTQLRWMLDTIVDYYVDSGVLDTDDDEVDIDMEQAAAYLCKRAREEDVEDLQPDEVFFVVQADLDYQEENC
jgi:hypothetical protein